MFPIEPEGNEIMITITKYIEMKERGATPEEVVLETRKDGLPLPKQLDFTRKVFNLSLEETKRIYISATTRFKSLEEYQEAILEDMINASKGGTFESLMDEISDELEGKT